MLVDSVSRLFLQLLSFPLEDCPRYQQLMNETEQTQQYLNFTQKYKVTFLTSTKKILNRSFLMSKLLSHLKIIRLQRMLLSSPQDFLELVSNKTGLNNSDVSSIWSVYDTLFCEVRRCGTAKLRAGRTAMRLLPFFVCVNAEPHDPAGCAAFELKRHCHEAGFELKHEYI